MAQHNREIEHALAALSSNYNLIPPADALAMMRAARNDQGNLLDEIRSHISDVDLLAIVAAELGFPFLDMNAASDEVVLEEALIKRCDSKRLRQLYAIPLRARNGSIVVAMANVGDVDAVNYIRSRFPEGYVLALSPKGQILARLYQIADDFVPRSQANIVPEWVDYLFMRAAAEGVSDVHLRTLIDGTLQIRFRVDGVLRTVPFPENLIGREVEVQAALLAKCPTIDSSNFRDTQDGTFSFEAVGRKIDVRVAMLPLIQGSNITCRLLDPENLNRRLEDMGFEPNKLAQMRAAASASQGSLLVVGPTGSGKSTTLLSLLGELDRETRNIITLEDPVEYRMRGIAQTQIRNQGDRPLTFSKVLRNVLRQDPDVILVGEMRDLETAKTAMHAALTGHMVLSTLHANTAPGAYMRLVEMGLEPFVVADAVSLIISQRLLRRLHTCAEWGPPTELEAAQLEAWGFGHITRVPHPVGCQGCNGIGFKGRLATTEVLAPDRHLRAAITRHAPTQEILRAAWDSGWRPILHDGIRHLEQGSTAVSELVRVLAAEDFDASDYTDDPDDDADQLTSGRDAEESAQ